jgi:hypothetical protein
VTIDGWRLLRPGSAPGAVLTIDFTLARVRAQANFGDLARLLPEGPAVWGTDESCWPATGGPPGRQLEQWLSRSRGFGGGVRGVLGFCAGASLAGALAAGLGGDGPVPPVVLLDPVAADAQTMIDACGDATRRMAGTGGAAGLAALPDPRAADDLDGLATLLTEGYAAVAAPVCAAQRIPQPIVAQLRQRVGTHLRYLALCATAALDRAGVAVLVLSRDHAVPARLRGAREVRLAAGQNELLADPGAALAVAGALAGAVPADRR